MTGWEAAGEGGAWAGAREAGEGLCKELPGHPPLRRPPPVKVAPSSLSTAPSAHTLQQACPLPGC